MHGLIHYGSLCHSQTMALRIADADAKCCPDGTPREAHRDAGAVGSIPNASEVLREGLRLMEQRAAEDDARLKLLRKAARAGFDELDRGEFKEFASPDEL